MLGFNKFYLKFESKKNHPQKVSEFIKIFAQKEEIYKSLKKESKLIKDITNLVLDYLYSSNENCCFDYNIYFCYKQDKTKNIPHCCIIPTFVEERKSAIEHLEFLIPHIGKEIFNNKGFKKFYGNKVKFLTYTVIDDINIIHRINRIKGPYMNPNKYKTKWLMNGIIKKY
jgi:hypothetical protein